MIETQYCSPAPKRSATPSHMMPRGKDVKAASYDEVRREGLGEKQMRVLSVMFREARAMTRNQLSALTGLQLSSVCGRIKELEDWGYVESAGTSKDPQTNKSRQLMQITDAGIQFFTSEQSRMKREAEAPKKKADKKPLSYAQRAGLLCRDHEFANYVYELVPERFKYAPPEMYSKNGKRVVDLYTQDVVKDYLNDRCGIESRRELDEVPDKESNEEEENNKVEAAPHASDLFQELVWQFALWVSKHPGKQCSALRFMKG